MFRALSRDPLSYLWGQWYKAQSDAQGVFFSYKLYDDTTTESRGTQGRNVVVNSADLRIETDFDLPFACGQYVTLANGQSYYIEGITTRVSPAAYQALGVTSIPETDKVLTLRMVKNTKAAEL